MRFSTAVAAALPIVLAAAQVTTGSTSTSATSSTGCNAMYIVEACVTRLKPQRDACTPNDWECLCNETVNLLTCYNNCPGEDAAVGYQSEKTAWCAAASAANPTPTKASASKDSSSSPTADAKPKDSDSSTAASSTPSPSGSSAAEMNGVKGAFVAAAGLVAIAAGML